MNAHASHTRPIDFPRLLGERRSLDFVNTIESPRDNPIDFLHSYPDLARWAAYADVITPAASVSLLRAAGERPQEGDAVWRDGVALRSAVQCIFAAVAAEQSVPEDALHILQQTYLSGLSHARLVTSPATSGYTWAWEAEGDLALPLWLVAQSAMDLLTTGDLTRVKECGGPDGCGWLFYDTSRNGSRRWCSMSGCGSQAKMRRYHARRKARA